MERKIKEEIDWLRNAIDVFDVEEKCAPRGCGECFLRKIAILIISGKLKASEIKRSPKLKNFWLDKKPDKNKKKINHGSDWHRQMMQKIENHFLSLKCKVIREPVLQQGRADLGIYKKGVPDLLIEVGTVSLFKLWLNLATMKNVIYLIVPNDERLIEFSCINLQNKPCFKPF